MEKNNFIGAVLALFLILVSGAAMADYSGGPAIGVALERYEPVPAEAGQYMDIWFNVVNLGTAASSGATIEFLPEFPFSIDTGNTAQSVGSIPAGSSVLVKYRVKVDEKATAGENILKIRYMPNSLSGWVAKDIPIFIQAHDAIISISGMSLEDLTPGKVQTLSLSLNNMADTYLQDIGVSLDFSSTTLPFAPLNSVNEKRILSIPAKGNANVSFDIITSPDATSGIYKVPLTLKYSDITNKTYTRQYLVGFVVNAAPDFEAAVQKYDIITEGSAGTATISVSNTGPGTIKFMTMDILPSEKYEILGESSIYLGNLNPDDYQTGVFKIYVNNGAIAAGKKTIPLSLALKYRDGLNNVYSKNINLDMRVYTPQEIKAYGLAPASSNTIVYAIIGIVVIYYIYRKYFRKKNRA